MEIAEVIGPKGNVGILKILNIDSLLITKLFFSKTFAHSNYRNKHNLLKLNYF